MTTTTLDTRTYQSDGRATLKCRDCKRKGTLRYVVTSTLTAYLGRPSTSSTLLAEDRTREISLGRDMDVKRALYRACPCGSIKVTVNLVRGTHNPDKACDARCTNATGPDCECSCTGANHGAAHSTW